MGSGGHPWATGKSLHSRLITTLHVFFSGIYDSGFSKLVVTYNFTGSDCNLFSGYQIEYAIPGNTIQYESYITDGVLYASGSIEFTLSGANAFCCNSKSLLTHGRLNFPQFFLVINGRGCLWATKIHSFKHSPKFIPIGIGIPSWIPNLGWNSKLKTDLNWYSKLNSSSDGRVRGPLWIWRAVYTLFKVGLNLNHCACCPLKPIPSPHL